MRRIAIVPSKAVLAGCLAGLMLCSGAAAIQVGTADSPAAPFSVEQAWAASGSSSSKTSNKSIVKNGMFTISASEFASRMDDAFGRLAIYNSAADNFSAACVKGTDDITLDIDIRKSSALVAYAKFSIANEDGFLSYSQRNTADSFNEVFIASPLTRSEETAVWMLAAIMAADPTLSPSDAVDISKELLRDAEERLDEEITAGIAKKNGIAYTLLLKDTTFFFAIDCSR